MRADTGRMRTTAQGLRPFAMATLKTLDGLPQVVGFIVARGLLGTGSTWCARGYAC